MMQLAPADIALAVEAACMLTFFRLALNFLPVQRLTAWMGKDGQAHLPSRRRRPSRPFAGLSGRSAPWCATAL